MDNYIAHESAVIDSNCKIGVGTRVWHFSHIMSGCSIGEQCNIGQNVVISPDVIIGNNVKIQNNVSVYTGVVCEDDVFLGPNLTFTNDLTPRSRMYDESKMGKTIVKKGASIGANTTILPGVEIGEWALIGAASLISEDVPSHSLWYFMPTAHR